ncbi:competence/damage-inducible protein A [Stygiobacter electus]|uniref:CinA-like protein n=1 Tax=Stygiobacter electus TaxID=3032292 RepID=A0AAE3P1E3_9BACT|nr:competence/damage-inducible protein A [Stygiobacter electus]MDF1612470.1 competence/damage-inducible protein A [Stygiobacter electus]
MKAHIISIGDEILIGQIINSNSAWIGEKLSEINIEVVSISVVGDDEKQIKQEFQRTFDANDLVIVTGGLGPTHDDVTRKCVVDFFKTELVLDEDVLNDVKKFFEVRNRSLTKINEDQALVPKIATPIRNSRGTAPGFWIEKDNKIFVVMPGVPFEMKGMMESFVLPRLEEMNSEEKIILRKNLLTTGIPESYLYEKLGNIDELMDGNKLAFLPNQFGVKMRLNVEGRSKEEAQNKLDEIEQRIRSLVGRYIYGKDDEQLEEVIAKLMIDRGMKLAVAESCTGGLICSRITNVSGSSQFFERGVITYSNAAKVELLHVQEDAIQKYGAVSLEVCRQMAEGVKAISGIDIGIAVTGILGPSGATPTKPVGLVYIGLCDDKICTAKEFHFGDNRLLNKDRASQAALEMLRRHLLGIPYDD